MRQVTDHALAKAYLVHRERDFSALYIIRGAIGLYSLQVAMFIVFLAGAFLLPPGPLKTFCIWGFGVEMGTFARDAGWLRRMKAQWPLTKSFIDWPKVEILAKQGP